MRIVGQERNTPLNALAIFYRINRIAKKFECCHYLLHCLQWIAQRKRRLKVRIESKEMLRIDDHNFMTQADDVVEAFDVGSVVIEDYKNS